jgi:hypothetical protein
MDNSNLQPARNKKIHYIMGIIIALMIVLIGSNIVVYAWINDKRTQENYQDLQQKHDQLTKKYEEAQKQIDVLKTEKSESVKDLMLTRQAYMYLEEKLKVLVQACKGPSAPANDQNSTKP